MGEGLASQMDLPVGQWLSIFFASRPITAIRYNLTTPI